MAVACLSDLDELVRWVPAAARWQRIEVARVSPRHRLLQAVCRLPAIGGSESVEDTLRNHLAEARPDDPSEGYTRLAAAARGEEDVSPGNRELLAELGLALDDLAVVVRYVEALPGVRISERERARRAKRMAWRERNRR